MPLGWSVGNRRQKDASIGRRVAGGLYHSADRAGRGVLRNISNHATDDVTRQTALRAITINPARVIGIDNRVGSLLVGKDADVVLWTGDPLDVMPQALRVFIGGRQVYSHDESARHATVFAR